MRKYVLSIMLLFVVALSGCASLGMVQPKNAQQALATTDVQFSALTQTTTDLINNGTITGANAVQANHYIHIGSDALDAAWTAVGNGTTNASALQTISTASLALNGLLQQYASQLKQQQGN